MADSKLTSEELEAKACELASELSNSIDNVDSMIEEMNYLADPSSELFSVKTCQQFVKQEFSDLFSSTPFLLELNSKLEELIKEEQELKHNLTTLRSKVESEMHCSNKDLQIKKAGENLEGFKKTDNQPMNENTDDGDDYDDHVHDHTAEESSCSVYQISIPWTRKLKLIECYYLPNSSEHVQLEVPTSSSAMQLKDTKIDDSGLRVKNMEELKYMIQELMIERCKEMKNAEDDGKQSYIQWLYIDVDVEIWTLHLIHAKIIEIGNRLCCHLCDLMFFVSKNPRQQGKWKVLEEILKLLMQLQQKDTKIIKRVVSVIEKAESLLIVIEKHNPLGDNDDYEKEIDEDFDMIFREVLCLESILSYPSLSCTDLMLMDELEAVQIGVAECDKEMDKIGSKVYAWKTHFLYEKPREAQLMEQFQTTIKRWIDSQWKSLDDEPEQMIVS